MSCEVICIHKVVSHDTFRCQPIKRNFLPNHVFTKNGQPYRSPIIDSRYC